MAFQFIQLTATNSYGAVAQGDLLPLGAVTRRYVTNCATQPTFVAGTTGNNTVTINEAGVYEVLYSGSPVAGAVGAVTLNLLVNGATVYTASETATAIGDTVNMTLPFLVRVLPSCASVSNVPVTIQVLNTGVALTGGTGNLIIRRIK